MTVTFEDLSNTRKKLIVEVSGDEIATEAVEVSKMFVEQARLPGFRPGKAPVAMIQKRFGKEIEERTKQAVAQKAYKHAMEDQQLQIYSLVEVEDVELKAGEDAELEFTVDLQPQVALPVYEGLTLESPSEAVTDEEFQDARRHVLDQRAEFNETDEPAQPGDFVQHSFTGSIEGTLIAELDPEQAIIGHLERTWDEAGSSRAPIPAIAEGLVGTVKGDTKTVEHTFPEDFESEALRGKTATYELEIFEVRRKTPPVIDEAFLQSLGLESEEAFNDHIRNDLQRRKTQQIRSLRRNILAEMLVKQAQFDVPESALAAERETILRDYIGRQYEQGVSAEELEERKEKLFEEATALSTNRVKAQFLFLEIAKKEEIELKPEDMQQVVLKEAQARHEKVDTIVKELQKNEGELRRLQREALIGKTLDYLLGKVNLKEVESKLINAGHEHHEHHEH